MCYSCSSPQALAYTCPKRWLYHGNSSKDCFILNLFPQVDLTANIARISMISYFCLLFAVFFLMFHMQTKFHTHTSDFSFLTVEIPITLSILLVSMSKWENCLVHWMSSLCSVRYVPRSNHIWRQIRRDGCSWLFFGIPNIFPWIPNYLLDDLLLENRTREEQLLASVNGDNAKANGGSGVLRARWYTQSNQPLTTVTFI